MGQPARKLRVTANSDEPWSYSRYDSMARCKRQFKYKYVDKLQGPQNGEGLIRGKAVDEVFNHLGKEYPDLCDEVAGTQPPEKAKGEGLLIPELLEQKDVLDALIRKKLPFYTTPEVVLARNIAIHGYGELARNGYRIARDKKGNPLVQVNLFGYVGDVKMRGWADFIAEDMDQTKRVLFDGKCTTQLKTYTPAWVRHAPQTAIYKILASLLEDKIGKIDEVGFYLMKPNKELYSATPITAPVSEVDDGIVDDLKIAKAEEHFLRRLGHWPRRLGSAYESPCNLCEFNKLCLEGDSSEITHDLRNARLERDDDVGEWF